MLKIELFSHYQLVAQFLGIVPSTVVKVFVVSFMAYEKMVEAVGLNDVDTFEDHIDAEGNSLEVVEDTGSTGMVEVEVEDRINVGVFIYD